MSTITTLLSNILGDYKKAAGLVDSNAAIKNPATNDNIATDGYGEAYVLDLSQAAQEILDSKSSGSVISLSEAQKEKLKDILDKYKDVPSSDDTIASLRADLQKAGLAPEQLATIQQAKDFNPVQVFLQILSGASEGNNDLSPTDSILSGLGSTASGTPLGDLIDKYRSISADNAAI